MSNKVQYAGNRVQEKHIQREADRRAVDSGEKSKAELRAQNGVFAFDVEIDFSSSSL